MYNCETFLAMRIHNNFYFLGKLYIGLKYSMLSQSQVLHRYVLNCAMIHVYFVSLLSTLFAFMLMEILLNFKMFSSNQLCNVA